MGLGDRRRRLDIPASGDSLGGRLLTADPWGIEDTRGAAAFLPWWLMAAVILVSVPLVAAAAVPFTRPSVARVIRLD